MFSRLCMLCLFSISKCLITSGLNYCLKSFGVFMVAKLSLRSTNGVMAWTIGRSSWIWSCCSFNYALCCVCKSFHFCFSFSMAPSLLFNLIYSRFSFNFSSSSSLVKPSARFVYASALILSPSGSSYPIPSKLPKLYPLPCAALVATSKSLTFDWSSTLYFASNYNYSKYIIPSYRWSSNYVLNNWFLSSLCFNCFFSSLFSFSSLSILE